MALTDYATTVERLQRALATPEDADGPNRDDQLRGVAYRIDPDYFLIIWPDFVQRLSELAAIPARDAAQALMRTGFLISLPNPKAAGQDRIPALKLRVIPASNSAARTLTAGFLTAEFIDKAYRFYAGEAPPDGGRLSGVRVAAADRPKVEAFFGQRVPPASLAYG